MSDDKRVTELVRRYIDGLITEPERIEIENLLNADHEARRIYVSHMKLHAAIKMSVAPAESHRRSERHLPHRRVSSWILRKTTLLSIAACLVIVVCAYLINYWQAERFSEAVVAHIRETSPDVQIVRLGDQIAAVFEMPIFSGDTIRTGRGQRLTLKYAGEATQIEVSEFSALDIETVEGGKRLHLDTGGIDVVAAPQPEGRPMVVTTVQAGVEVKGTGFSLEVTRGQTRVEVNEGLVRLTRLSDNVFVDVPAGRYAVAAPDVELAARALETMPRSYGKTVFVDDFDGTLDNWDIVVGTPDGTFSIATGKDRQCVSLQEDFRHDPYGDEKTIVESCVVFDGEGSEGRMVGIRSRKPIDLNRFVVKVWCAVLRPTDANRERRHLICIYDSAIEVREDDATVIELNKAGRTSPSDRSWGSRESAYDRSWRTYRWEFTPAADAVGENIFLCMKFRGVYEGSSYVRSPGKRLVFAIANRGMAIDRVEVCEIIEE